MVAHHNLVARWAFRRVDVLLWLSAILLSSIVFVALVLGPMLLMPALGILIPTTAVSAIGWFQYRRSVAWSAKASFAYTALAVTMTTYCLVVYPRKVLPFSVVGGIFLGLPCSVVYRARLEAKMKENHPGLSRSID